MTDTPPELRGRLPAGTVIITPAVDRDLTIAHGYVGETGQDIITVSIDDTEKGPHTVVFTPVLARHVAETIIGRCDNLDRVRNINQKNGEQSHD